jgi:hypothetical protein
VSRKGGLTIGGRPPALPVALYEQICSAVDGLSMTDRRLLARGLNDHVPFEDLPAELQDMFSDLAKWAWGEGAPGGS